MRLQESRSYTVVSRQRVRIVTETRGEESSPIDNVCSRLQYLACTSDAATNLGGRSGSPTTTAYRNGPAGRGPPGLRGRLISPEGKTPESIGLRGTPGDEGRSPRGV